MSDDDPIVELLVAIINQAHADARMPQKCSYIERGAVRRDALAFLEWAQAEGEELREELAHHVPKRGGRRATLLWTVGPHPINARRESNRVANQKRRGKPAS